MAQIQIESDTCIKVVNAAKLILTFFEKKLVKCIALHRGTRKKQTTRITFILTISISIVVSLSLIYLSIQTPPSEPIFICWHTPIESSSEQNKKFFFFKKKINNAKWEKQEHQKIYYVRNLLLLMINETDTIC